jgi:6,7-dimethyl-8-ribityllumazine synthase
MIEGDAGTAAGLRFAIVVARFNDFVTERLLTGAIAALHGAGVPDADIAVLRVPGSFEIPLAARRAAETGRYDGIICLGCLIRGETPHFDYIASSVAHELAASAGATGIPMAFGVLTTNSAEEALARAQPGPANKGHEAALAAAEMASLLRRLDRPARGAAV